MVGERDWVYRCTFDLTPVQLAYPSRHLLFEGLDTYARVYLNGQLILSSDNMFVRHEVDVRRYLRRTNTLELHFSSPLRAALPLYEASGKLNYPSGQRPCPAQALRLHPQGALSLRLGLG